MNLAKKLLGGLVDVVRWESAHSLTCLRPEGGFVASPLSSFPVFIATSTRPCLCPLTPWVPLVTSLARCRPHCPDHFLSWSLVLTSAVFVPQPPPRRPAVYAEQHESPEETQFRRVFQQLAGDVSVDKHTLGCICYISFIGEHFWEPAQLTLWCVWCRTWRWAPLSWWTSWTESFQSVSHHFMCVHI